MLETTIDERDEVINNLRSSRLTWAIAMLAVGLVTGLCVAYWLLGRVFHFHI